MDMLPVIVLRTIRYSDSSVIVRLLSPGGKFSAVVSGSHRKKSKMRSSHFMPGRILEANFKGGSKDLPRIHDCNLRLTYQKLDSDPQYQAQLLFLGELLDKVLRDSEPSEDLFRFVQEYLVHLDHLELPHAEFAFLLRLSKFLGFYPDLDDSLAYFDLMAGRSTAVQPSHNYYLKGKHLEHFIALHRTSGYEEEQYPGYKHKTWHELWKILLTYYRLHLEGFEAPNSTEQFMLLTDPE